MSLCFPASGRQWPLACFRSGLFTPYPGEQAKQPLGVQVCVLGVGEGSFSSFPPTNAFLPPLLKHMDVGEQRLVSAGNHARRSNAAYLVLEIGFPAPQPCSFVYIVTHCCFPVSEAELSGWDHMTHRAQTISYWVLHRKHVQVHLNL